MEAYSYPSLAVEDDNLVENFAELEAYSFPSLAVEDNLVGAEVVDNLVVEACSYPSLVVGEDNLVDYSSRVEHHASSSWVVVVVVEKEADMEVVEKLVCHTVEGETLVVATMMKIVVMVFCV